MPSTRHQADRYYRVAAESPAASRIEFSIYSGTPHGDLRSQKICCPQLQDKFFFISFDPSNRGHTTGRMQPDEVQFVHFNDVVSFVLARSTLL